MFVSCDSKRTGILSFVAYRLSTFGHIYLCKVGPQLKKENNGLHSLGKPKTVTNTHPDIVHSLQNKTVHHRMFYLIKCFELSNSLLEEFNRTAFFFKYLLNTSAQTYLQWLIDNTNK